MSLEANHLIGEYMTLSAYNIMTTKQRQAHGRHYGMTLIVLSIDYVN